MLTPLHIAAQLARFAWRTERLPEATGPRSGVLGSGPPLRLLILGDSSAAGVGVTTQEDALAGQVAAALSPHLTLDWQLLALSGATTARAVGMVANARACDVAITALGVNDVLRHTGDRRFAQAQTALHARLRAKGARVILCSAVPPLGDFAAFPQPLRGHLGARAAKLDAVLQQVCTRTDAQHVPFDVTPSADWLARDGLHPSAKLYHHWGARMAGLVLRAVS
jgi:lysophospholipase L1-like esterase